MYVRKQSISSTASQYHLIVSSPPQSLPSSRRSFAPCPPTLPSCEVAEHEDLRGGRKRLVVFTFGLAPVKVGSFMVAAR